MTRVAGGGGGTGDFVAYGRGKSGPCLVGGKEIMVSSERVVGLCGYQSRSTLLRARGGCKGLMSFVVNGLVGGRLSIRRYAGSACLNI